MKANNMVSKFNERAIYQRLIAALTQRQMPLTVQKQVIPTALKRLRTKTRKASEHAPKNAMTFRLKASTNKDMARIYAFAIPTVRNPNVKFTYKDSQESPLAYNPPYGVLPQLATLEPDDLQKLADHFSILKFQYQDRGDYYHAWLFGWRERLIERILEGVAKLEVEL